MKIKQPTLLVDKNIVLSNIKKMVEKANRNSVILRPHFKTHQSAEVGEWFNDFGVDCITVSSVRMAQCFADAGWRDITIAFPVNILEIEEINSLAKKIKLNLLVNTIDTVRFLQQNIKTQTDIWIKVDTGYHRTGIPWDNSNEIIELAQEIGDSSNLSFAGTLVHAGHSYKSRSNSEILEVHRETLEKVTGLKKQLLENGIDRVNISVGDTPTASIAEDFEGVDELRPGNFVFYDLKQLQINSCSEEEIAVRFACPVVAKSKERLEFVIDGGAIHFSKDFIEDEEGKKIFGYLTEEINGKWSTRIKGAYVSSLSQEHGIIKVERDLFDEISIGDIILILPVHACLAVNIMGKFRLTTGEEFDALCR